MFFHSGFYKMRHTIDALKINLTSIQGDLSKEQWPWRRLGVIVIFKDASAGREHFVTVIWT